jgi:hypothetical protein
MPTYNDFGFRALVQGRCLGLLGSGQGLEQVLPGLPALLLVI